jgi:hypothetical protein
VGFDSNARKDKIFCSKEEHQKNLKTCHGLYLNIDVFEHVKKLLFIS